MPETTTFQFRGRGLTLRRGDPALMGILNVTPDSFSDGGRYDEREAALAHALAMLDAGAAIIDVGGESTRPGHQRVPEEEELCRVLPVIRQLRAATDAPISIDTSKASVAAAALEAGADIVNDVTALADPAMPQVVAKYRAGCILMHYEQLTPNTDAPTAVTNWLARRLDEAQRLCDLPPEHFVVDPGIGFGKSVPQNLALIARLDALCELPAAILLAMSRKSFIGAVANVPDAADRLPGTIAAAVLADANCHLLRVHDVAETRQALAIAQALRKAHDKP